MSTDASILMQTFHGCSVSQPFLTRDPILKSHIFGDRRHPSRCGGFLLAFFYQIALIVFAFILKNPITFGHFSHPL